MFKFFKNNPHINKRIIFSGAMGNLLESFDIMICAFLAQTISQTFFPPSDASRSLFYTFLIFLAGYLSRPVGSLLIGLFADQVGRKKMLVISILLTGTCTAIIGIIPSYHYIGYSALFLFLLFRILQNISVGGETISSISYLIESAKDNMRGFYGSWITVGFNGGTLLASLAVYIVMYGINNHYLPTWGWRIVFLLAIIGTIVGLWIRASLPESLGYILNNSSSQKNKKSDILISSFNLIKTHPLRCLSLIAIGWLGVSQTSTVFMYSPIHMSMINNLSHQEAMEINTISLILLTLLIPFFGYIYDRIDRIKLLTVTTISFIIICPIYFYYLSYGTYSQVLCLKLLYSIPSACYYPVATVLITEAFPIKIRCTSLALVYQTTSAFAAGLTPIILLQLVNNYHVFLAPSLYIMISGVVCLLGLYYLHIGRDVSLSNPVSSEKLALQNINS